MFSIADIIFRSEGVRILFETVSKVWKYIFPKEFFKGFQQAFKQCFLKVINLDKKHGIRILWTAEENFQKIHWLAKTWIYLTPYGTIRMYWTHSWRQTVHLHKYVFKKTFIKVGSSHLYASFGTFCVQIGQFFEA